MQDLVLKYITFSYIFKLYKNKYMIITTICIFSLLYIKNCINYLNHLKLLGYRILFISLTTLNNIHWGRIYFPFYLPINISLAYASALFSL